MTGTALHAVDLIRKKRDGEELTEEEIRFLVEGAAQETIPEEQLSAWLMAVFLRGLEAIRAMPADRRPARVIGFEAWRDLDWLLDSDKVLLDSGRHPELAAELVKVFDSQIGGGKRYDLAAAGRRLAHATFHLSHSVDRVAGITWAVDLTPLVRNPALSVESFVSDLIGRFQADVIRRLRLVC